MTLPQPLSSGETLKICAFDEDVVIEGCGEVIELRRGESASFVTVLVDDTRRWERVQALP